MNMPECANCTVNRSAVCRQLFEMAFKTELTVAEILGQDEFIKNKPNEILDLSNRLSADNARRTGMLLTRLGCELTPEQVALRILRSEA